MSIVYVSDNILLYEEFCARLKGLPCALVDSKLYQVSQALTVINAYRPKVLLIDATLSGFKALELVKRIKTASRKTILIALTDYPHVITFQIWKEAGADYFFDKLFQIDEATTTINNLLKV